MQIQIKINAEYQSLCPQLSKNEYNSLKKSIEEFGLYEAITISKEGIILDGHHRYKACKELGVKPRFKEKEFPEELDEKRYIIEINLERRQLTPLQRVELAIKIEDIESQKAHKRQILLGKTHGKAPLCSNEQKGSARDIAAEKAKLSPTTYHRAKTILEKGSPKLIEKVRKGKTSIAYAYESIKRREKHKNPPPLPQGTFDVIYADPPWQYYYMALQGNPEEHYPTLPNQKIKELDVPTADNAVLYLWVTNPMIQEALEVLEAWGFEYKTNIVWVKDGLGVGHYVRGNHELLFIAKKGDIPTPTEENRPISVLHASKSEHSKKPDLVYEIIESMYPNRKYLELFARNTRDGWKSWGDEI